jgi:signal transduction histidine kinase
MTGLNRPEEKTMVKVLIADDHLVTRKLLQSVLEKNGYEVIAVGNGQQAWQVLNQESDVRLAILDWMMPEMDGVEICRKLQDEHKSSLYYVILLTAMGGTENITAALQAGANDYVTKPFEKDELLARLKVGERIIDLQKELTQAQKLESIGQLAAGIAHEINTPIQYVGDNIRFMQEAFQDFCHVLQGYAEVMDLSQEQAGRTEKGNDLKKLILEVDLDFLKEEIPSAIQHSIEGVEHISKIVRAMKEFAHPGIKEKTEIDINKAIESTITVATNNWKYVATVDTDFDLDLPLVSCHPAEFNQVVLNLIVNAVDAISDMLGQESSEKGKIAISTLQEDDEVVIRISDTGTGIPEEIREQIFNPFYTTKEVGKGSGQGLAISRSIIVDKHGGSLTFETECGEGTTFIIRLPIQKEQTDDMDESGYGSEKENIVCG